MVTRLRLGLAITLIAVASACGRSTRQSDLEQVPSNTPVTVSVTNNHPQDITVFAVRGDERTRLGTVTTSQTQTFSVPLGATRSGSDFSILVHPIGGGGDYTTGRVIVNPGDEVAMTVAPAISQTSYMISQH